MKIGVNPLSWSNDDLPSLGAETSLEQCLREGREAGYYGFELGNKFPREALALSKVLSRHHLELASGWFSGSILNNRVDQEIERLKPHCDLLSVCGSKVLVYCDTTDSIQDQAETPLSMRKRLTDRQWPAFCDKLSEVASWCRQQGLPIAYHFHMGTMVQTDDEVDRLMADTSEDLGLLFDTGHAAFAGSDPLELARRHIGRIRHVHLKDVRYRLMKSLLNRGVSFIDAVLAGIFTVPGDGDIPINEIVNLLVQGGYDDWLIVEAEQDPTVAPSFSMVSKAWQYVNSALEQLELCK